jgi:hypothetical protein
MNGNVMYELALQGITDRQRAAEQAREARKHRAAARGARAAERAARRGTGTVAVPAIPDFAHEMFTQAGAAVNGQRPGERASR